MKLGLVLLNTCRGSHDCGIHSVLSGVSVGLYSMPILKLSYLKIQNIVCTIILNCRMIFGAVKISRDCCGRWDEHGVLSGVSFR